MPPRGGMRSTGSRSRRGRDSSDRSSWACASPSRSPSRGESPSSARTTSSRTSTPSSSRTTSLSRTSRCWCPAATRPSSASKHGEGWDSWAARSTMRRGGGCARRGGRGGGEMVGVGYPGGVAIGRLARAGDASRFHFPRAWLSRDSADFSFSGLKTALRTFLASPEGKAARVEDVAASFQEAAVEVLVGKALSAAKRERVPRLVYTGGGSANSRLRAMASQAGAGGGGGSGGDVLRAGPEPLILFPVPPRSGPFHKWPLSPRGGPSPPSACPP